MVPCTCVAPASSPAIALATPTPQSLCVWMPRRTFNFPFANAVMRETVEAVLGVVDDRLAVVLQEADGVANHRQILIRLGAQDFVDMEQPALADDGHHRRLRLEDLTHQFVLLDGHALAAGHAERGD